MSHNKAAGQTLSPWYDVHGEHEFECVATTQVHFICHTCEMIMTADQIAAGFKTSAKAAMSADDVIEIIEEEKEASDDA